MTVKSLATKLVKYPSVAVVWPVICWACKPHILGKKKAILHTVLEVILGKASNINEDMVKKISQLMDYS